MEMVNKANNKIIEDLNFLENMDKLVIFILNLET